MYTKGVRDKFRLGGLRSVARIFYLLYITIFFWPENGSYAYGVYAALGLHINMDKHFTSYHPSYRT